MSHKLIGIFGGTFDPIHKGHLHIAKELLKQLPFQEICFIPCKDPVLKSQAQANQKQRLAMLKLALARQKHLTIDERELQRSTPSYTVETLESLREDYPDTPLCLIIGMDAFRELPLWKQWKKLLSLAHFIIVQRPDTPLPKNRYLQKLLHTKVTTAAKDLQNEIAGKIYLANITPLDIASRDIREAITKGKNQNALLTKPVLDYIKKEGIYTMT